MLDLQQIEEIKKLKDKGATIAQVARELNIGRSTVKFYGWGEEGSEETETHGGGERRPKLKRPLILNPSPKLKEKREEAESMDLQVSIEKRSKELEKIKRGGVGEDTSGIKSKEDEVKLTELDAKQIKIRNEIKKLKEEEREEAERGGRKELLERVKINIVPVFLRKELPSPLLAITLTEITKVLVPLINLGETNEEELKICGKVIRDKIFLDPQYSKIIRSAQQRIVLNALERCLRECKQLLEEETYLEEKIYLPIELQIRD